LIVNTPGVSLSGACVRILRGSAVGAGGDKGALWQFEGAFFLQDWVSWSFCNAQNDFLVLGSFAVLNAGFCNLLVRGEA